MRRLATVALLLVASTWCTTAQAQLTFDSCKVDGEVATDQRTPYQQAALDFAALLVKQDVAQIHSRFTADLRSGVTLDQISTGLLRPLAPMVEGLGALRVSHSYLVTSHGSGANHTVMCSSVASGSSSAAMGDKVFLATKSGVTQAHVIVDADNRNYTVTFALWLVDASSDWLVQGLHVVPTATLGKTAADFRAMAQQQRDRGHAFTAAVLYSDAASLADRGKYLKLSLRQDIQTEAKALEWPQELKGERPFTWQIDSDTFRILALGSMGVGGKLALMVQREVSSIADTSAVDVESKRFIAGFTKKHPEIREVFDAIVVRALEANSGKGFGTVEDFQK